MSTGLCSSGSVLGGNKRVFHKHQHNTPRRGRKDRVKSPLTQCRPRHDEWRWLRVKTATRTSRSADNDAEAARTRGKTRPSFAATSAITPQKQKVGQGLGWCARRGLAAAAAPSEATHSRTRASHTARSRLLLCFKFLTGSERFHGRGLSLRLCPGLAAPYRR